jgi:hypothetical protein
MLWEIVLGIILAIGILTTINEIRSKRTRKKLLTQNEYSQDTKVSDGQVIKKHKS